MSQEQHSSLSCAGQLAERLELLVLWRPGAIGCCWHSCGSLVGRSAGCSTDTSERYCGAEGLGRQLLTGLAATAAASRQVSGRPSQGQRPELRLTWLARGRMLSAGRALGLLPPELILRVRKCELQRKIEPALALIDLQQSLELAQPSCPRLT